MQTLEIARIHADGNTYLKRKTGQTRRILLWKTKAVLFILSSKDLCMIQHIPELVHAGVTAWKIEGRMKSQYYVAAVTRIYREALDRYFADPCGYVYDQRWLSELEKVSHREYGTGFFLEIKGIIARQRILGIST